LRIEVKRQTLDKITIHKRPSSLAPTTTEEQKILDQG
jgi:hypothetical protein